MATYDQLIAHYFEKVDAGEPIDPAEIIAENPEHSRQLRRFFANLGVLNEFIDKLSQDPPQDVDGAILGDFRIVRELGRGGMGVVYEAEQVSVGRRVALKVLHASAAADSQLARFRNEIQVIASLSHDHIVSVFAVGEQEGNQFFAMQLIEGASLAEVLHEAKAKSLLPLDGMGRNGRSSDRSSSTTARATRSLQDADTADETSSESNASKLFADTQRKERFRRVVTLVETVARTLDYAHAKGIIHRDIKPSNLMLDQEGKVNGT